MADPPWLEPPPGLAARLRAFEWVLAYQYRGHSAVYRLKRGATTESFVKLQPAGEYPSLAAEAERARWAIAHVPAPEVLDLGAEEGVDWLMTAPIAGCDATDAQLRADPENLARLLGRALREFHDRLPVEGCPFDFRLDAALSHVRRRHSAGGIDPARDFHEEFAGMTATEAVELVERTRPESEDLVVCHGDYCLPNIMFLEGRLTGYLDLGELGVADRWWDLAVATWSLGWNLGPGHEATFLEEYGVSLDQDRNRFYRLLYDLVS